MKSSFLYAILLAALTPAIVFAQWSPKVKLSTHAVATQLNENMATCLGVSGYKVHVVWSDHRPSGSSIWYKRSLDTGLTWNSEVPITDTTGSASFPAIAVSGNIIHVAWFDSLLGKRASFYKRSLDGGNTWGPKYCLDSDTKFWPGLAASGSMVVVSLNKEVVVGNTEVFFRSSMDDGATWGVRQQISNAIDRSEDPAIAAQGRHIHLSWNDKRSGTMEIYYRHSADAGAAWGPETPLTLANSYTTMVCLDGAHVDVPYGYNPTSGNFDVNLRQSSDTGVNFGTAKQLTATPTVGEAYPYMIRSGADLHVVYSQFSTGPVYLHSADSGATWTAPYNIGHGGTAFIALTCPVLHVIWGDSGNAYYTRNPTGNACPAVATGIGETHLSSRNTALSIYPNPAGQEINISFPGTGNYTIDVYNATGQKVKSVTASSQKLKLSTDGWSSGIYLVKVQADWGVYVERMLKE